MKNELLILFSKSPEIGKVKTRFIPVLGEEKAFDLYKKLLQQTLSNCFPNKLEKLADERNSEVWLRGNLDNAFIEEQLKSFPFSVKSQVGNNLGESMGHAFDRSFSDASAHYEKVVLIGGDCVSIEKLTIEKSFEQLNDTDCVICPAQDGGFVLIGFNKGIFQSSFFEGIEWGGESVFHKLCENLNVCGVSFICLDTLWDVDVPEDLPLLKGLPLFESFL